MIIGITRVILLITCESNQHGPVRRLVVAASAVKRALESGYTWNSDTADTLCPKHVRDTLLVHTPFFHLCQLVLTRLVCMNSVSYICTKHSVQRAFDSLFFKLFVDAQERTRSRLYACSCVCVCVCVCVIYIQFRFHLCQLLL